MSAFPLNLRIDQGATFSKLATWKTGTPPVPVDLTGATARMQMRSNVKADTVLVSLTTANGGIVLGGTAGTVQIKITAAATAALTWTTAKYDLEIVFADTSVRRLLSGSVEVSPEVTR